MTERPRILLLGDVSEGTAPLIKNLGDTVEAVAVQNPIRAFARLAREKFDAVFVSSPHLREALELGKLLQNERILEQMPDGVVLLDADNTVIWGNGRLREWTGREAIVGVNFYSVLGSPEILGPDFCPFHTALASGTRSCSTLRSTDNRYFRVHAAPVLDKDGPAQNLIVTIRDVTSEVLQQQKLAAIHQAGVELADLSPDELSHMTIEERIELLKSNILHFTQDLLNFDVVEIRLLDAKTGQLEPLLGGGHGSGGHGSSPVRSTAKQRRHRLRGGHGQELFVRRHDRRSALSRRL